MDSVNCNYPSKIG